MKAGGIVKVALGLLILFASAAAQTQKFSAGKSSMIFSRITIRVADVKAMADWYRSVFRFAEKKSESDSKTILKKDDFLLELVPEKTTVASRKLVLPDEMRFLARFNKFGFVVNDLDELFAETERRKVENVGGIFTDERLQFRTFIVRDPDGNMVQFFEPRGFLEKFRPRKNEWKPVFLMLLTDNYQRTADWYRENLAFKEIVNVDNPARKIVHRTLFNGGVLLELAEITGKVAARGKYPEIWKTAGGIMSVGFSTKTKERKSIYDDGANAIELGRK